MRRAALPIGLALVSALAVPAGAGGAGCAAARTQPVEVETLQVSVVPDDRPRRAGEQVAIRVRVTRAVKPDSPVSPFTELLPVELALSMEFSPRAPECSTTPRTRPTRRAGRR